MNERKQFGNNVRLGYPENRWQGEARFVAYHSKNPLVIQNWYQLDGAAPGYNNVCDMSRLLWTATHIAAAYEANKLPNPVIALGVKHGNPCSAGVGGNAFLKMVAGGGEPLFGGSVATNVVVTKDMAEVLCHGYTPLKRRPIDLIMAPGYEPEALEILARVKGKCRIFENAAMAELGLKSLDKGQLIRTVFGGALLQDNYTYVPDFSGPDFTVHGEALTVRETEDLAFLFGIGATSNSNTITIGKNGVLIGNGVGQQARNRAAKLAVMIANEILSYESVPDSLRAELGMTLEGSCAYSDSFFPFPDGLKILANAGVRTVFATSGSVKDGDVIEFAKKAGVKLVMTPDDKGRGFFGH